MSKQRKFQIFGGPFPSKIIKYPPCADLFLHTPLFHGAFIFQFIPFLSYTPSYEMHITISAPSFSYHGLGILFMMPYNIPNPSTAGVPPSCLRNYESVELIIHGFTWSLNF